MRRKPTARNIEAKKSPAPVRAGRRVVLGLSEPMGSPLQDRTMMLAEVSALLAALPGDATVTDYRGAVVDDNVLGKASAMNRRKTFEILLRFYGLDASRPMFRTFRRYWRADDRAHGTLAVVAALGADQTLRATWEFVAQIPQGSVLNSKDLTSFLAKLLPQLGLESLTALRQRVASTWAQAGHFSCQVRKVRQRPEVTPAVVALALFFGYLDGRRGQRLFDTIWTAVLERPEPELLALAAAAAQRGLLQFLRAGSVVEVRFPGLLTDAEEEVCREPA